MAYFEDRRNNAHVDIEVFEETKEMTMEIWLKSDKPFRRSGYILALTHIDEDDNEEDTYMVIGVEKEKYTCAPFRTL